MIASVEALDRAALMAILVEPRNALLKQFHKLFELDAVDLVFTDEAVAAIADLALERHTGARGLRAIVEETLLDVMFEVPGRDEVAQVVVDADAIRGAGSVALIPRIQLVAEPELRRRAA